MFALDLSEAQQILHMPLRAKIDEPKLPKMSALETNGYGIHANGITPKTGIKVIIIGAGTLLYKYTQFRI